MAIGYSGFASGPEKHFIDVLGLSDPLLARLPLHAQSTFRPGHFHRGVPEGYLDSVEQETNLTVDPNLRRYYEPLRSITRGPLWSLERLKSILTFHLGDYDAYLEAYALSHGLRTRQ